MKNLTRILNQKGFGLLETMIGFAIMGVGTFLILQGLDMFDDSKVRADKSINLENTLSNVLESVKANIILEKIDFQAEEAFFVHTTYQAVKDNLKLCWVKDGVIPLENYPTCPGRIGYVVTPLKVGTLSLRGLYKVVIRLTHDELYPGSFKQYEFIVKGP